MWYKHSNVNKEFHFNTIYVLAREAGFTEADSFILAGSSQFVDEAVFTLRFSMPDEELQFLITQSYDFWDDVTQKTVYIPFHFIPGNINEPCEQLKTNGKNPYCVLANGTLAKEALITCLEQRDVFLIGIALHGFADTWAHQNFSGKNEQWNAHTENNGFLNTTKQAIGHMQFGSQPDACGALWQDTRLYDPVCNNIVRFREAAKKIYRYLCIYNNRSFDNEEFILDKLCSIWKHSNEDERSADYIITWSVPEWSYKLWFEQAGLVSLIQNTKGLFESFLHPKLKHKIELFINHLNTKIIACPLSFKQSNLYHWTQSAHYYKNIMSKIFEKEHLL